jgi:hypothetical protein
MMISHVDVGSDISTEIPTLDLGTYKLNGGRGRGGDAPAAADNAIPVAPPLQEPTFPDGPIVWCVRPEGTFGFWRCSVLYTDLSVGTYWSPSDDSGGSLP